MNTVDLNQEVLETSIERMGVWMSRHPAGTLVLAQGDERVFIHGYPGEWHVKWISGRQVNPYKERTYPRKKVQKLVHKLLVWNWRTRERKSRGLYSVDA